MTFRHTQLSTATQSIPVRHVDAAVIDRKLQENVQLAINGKGHPNLSIAVEVHVSGGVVELSGSIPSYYQKQVAQTAAMQVAGVVRLKNNLQVSAANSGTSRCPSVRNSH